MIKKFREHLRSQQVGAEKPTQACRPSKAAVPETKATSTDKMKWGNVAGNKLYMTEIHDLQTTSTVSLIST